MTNILAPLAPVGAPVRDGPAIAIASGNRPVALSTGVETARAPRPVEAVAAADRLRHHGARERPVGPAPAFDITVLQDIRERLADAGQEPMPAARSDADSEAASTPKSAGHHSAGSAQAGTDAAPAEPESAAATMVPRAAAPPSGGETAIRLDKKV